MELPSYFRDFLSKIRPTSAHIDDFKRGHRTLTDRLWADENLSPIMVSTFLQGSYRRSTAIRPSSGKRSDVDVVVVTTLSEEQYPDPVDAMNLFVPFLEKHYKDKYEPQGRSFGIELSYVELDLVITSAPSEAEIRALKSTSVTTDETVEEVEDWKLVPSWIPLSERKSYFSEEQLRKAAKEAEWQLSPLRIPDRDAKKWDPTHPLEQIRWTHKKNKSCNKHYVNIVKALKWWRRVKHETPKYPKGYPVEHLIGLCCPDDISSVAQGVALTLEAIASNYQLEAALKIAPTLPDHGVPEHNVFHRVSGEDFAVFHSQVCDAAKIAREALDIEDDVKKSAEKWQELFGDRFDVPPDSDDDNEDDGGTKRGGFTGREAPTVIREGRYAQRRNKL